MTIIFMGCQCRKSSSIDPLRATIIAGDLFPKITNPKHLTARKMPTFRAKKSTRLAALSETPLHLRAKNF
jgi:hypothetical protein